MKKLLFILGLILIALVSFSCSSDSGIKIGSKSDPCVITGIKVADEAGMVWYETTTGTFGMQKDLFAIGDTLDFTNLGVSKRLLASFYANVPTTKIQSQNTKADTTITVNLSMLRITPGLLVGLNKDTLSVGYDRDLILGKSSDK